MRGAGAIAAALLLALALGANGCKPSSLTPFGIGTQDYEVDADSINGTWAGQTASGGVVSFQVGSETASSLRFHHVRDTCDLLFEDLSTNFPIANNEFTFEIELDQGRFVATGSFTSTTAVSGTYFFEALQAGICPTAGTGTFSATKIL